MKFLLFDCDYKLEEGKPVIRMWGRDEKGKPVCVMKRGFAPYFYTEYGAGGPAVMKALEELGPERVSSEERVIGKKKEKLLKVYMQSPADVSAGAAELRHSLGLKTFEYSVNFCRRFMMDMRLEPMGWHDAEGKMKEGLFEAGSVSPAEDSEYNLKALAFDIEVVGEGGEQKIAMISVFGERFRKVFVCGKKASGRNFITSNSEKEMLESFMSAVERYGPDIILTFNGDAFDFPILAERCEKNGLKPILSRDGSEAKFERRMRSPSAMVKGRCHIDLFRFAEGLLSPYLQTEVLSLDAVSKEMTGEGKIDTEFADFFEAWKNGKSITKFAEHCLRDSELTYMLGSVLLPQIFEISRIARRLPFDVSRTSYGRLVEWYLSAKAVETGRMIPNIPKYRQIQERRGFTYEGGFVKEPVAGIHEDMAVMDFRSLYPSIIATFGISPENLDRKAGAEIPGTPYMFGAGNGFVSSAVRELIERRQEIKKVMQKPDIIPGKRSMLDARQHALKIIANASYGMFAFPGARWYCRECAEACASLGRHYIKLAIKSAEESGLEVIYADTDSCFVRAGNGTRKKAENFLEKINRELPGMIRLDFQGMYRRGIFIPKGTGAGTAKKRYALLDSEGNILIRGLEKVRRDWSGIAKDTQENVIRMVLEKKDAGEAVKYVKSVVSDIRKGNVQMKKFIIYEQLTRPLSEYKATGPHTEAAKKMKERGKPVGPGTLIMFVITKGSGSISERAEPFEDVKPEDIDAEYYISRQIVPASLRVLQVLGVTERELIGKQSDLRGFVKN